MANRGEIEINSTHCKGCGLCVKYCPKGCIVQPGDQFTAGGQLLPVFVEKDKCTACGICVWMCPDFAIEAYKLVEA